jgi:hypothetical protein
MESGPLLSQVPGFGRPGKVRFERLPQVQRIKVEGDQTTFYWVAGIEITMRRHREIGRSDGFSNGRIHFLQITRDDVVLALFDRGVLVVAPAFESVEATIFARVVAAYNQ